MVRIKKTTEILKCPSYPNTRSIHTTDLSLELYFTSSLSSLDRGRYDYAFVVLSSESNDASKSDYTKPRKLYTPGPLMVSPRVKEAMLPDVGTRHSDFEHVIK